GGHNHHRQARSKLPPAESDFCMPSMGSRRSNNQDRGTAHRTAVRGQSHTGVKTCLDLPSANRDGDKNKRSKSNSEEHQSGPHRLTGLRRSTALHADNQTRLIKTPKRTHEKTTFADSIPDAPSCPHASDCKGPDDQRSLSVVRVELRRVDSFVECDAGS